MISEPRRSRPARFAFTLLATQPVPAGPRVGVVTNAGGPGILLADACETRGLALPELTEETVAKLRGFLPAAAGLKNPVDMIASASPEQFARTIEAVGARRRCDGRGCALARRPSHTRSGMIRGVRSAA